MCERCGDERCSDPDSKWCSDILLMRYKAERDGWRDLHEAGSLPYTLEIERLQAKNDALRADAERDEQRELLAAMMIRCSLSTGHGDTLADLVTELEPQIESTRADAERLLKLIDEHHDQDCYHMRGPYGEQWPDPERRCTCWCVDAARKEKP